MDYFPWGYIKANVRSRGQDSNEQLKETAEDVCEGIDRDVVLSAVGNLHKCCEFCLNEGGDPFQKILQARCSKNRTRYTIFRSPLNGHY